MSDKADIYDNLGGQFVHTQKRKKKNPKKVKSQFYSIFGRVQLAYQQTYDIVFLLKEVLSPLVWQSQTNCKTIYDPCFT